MAGLARVALALTLGLTPVACESPDRAEDPVWGKQACGSCAMLVSEPVHAAQLVTGDGTRVFFDDVGCLAAYLQERGITAPKLWVRDANGKWVDARTARFKSGAKTPMDYGFVHAADGDATFANVEQAVKKRAEQKQ